MLRHSTVVSQTVVCPPDGYLSISSWEHPLASPADWSSAPWAGWCCRYWRSLRTLRVLMCCQEGVCRLKQAYDGIVDSYANCRGSCDEPTINLRWARTSLSMTFVMWEVSAIGLRPLRAISHPFFGAGTRQDVFHFHWKWKSLKVQTHVGELKNRAGSFSTRWLMPSGPAAFSVQASSAPSSLGSLWCMDPWGWWVVCQLWWVSRWVSVTEWLVLVSLRPFCVVLWEGDSVMVLMVVETGVSG